MMFQVFETSLDEAFNVAGTGHEPFFRIMGSATVRLRLLINA